MTKCQPGPRKTALLVIGISFLAFARPCVAQPAPKSVTFVVSFAAGGVADVIARMVAQKLSSQSGEKFIVENKGGAGGNLAARAVSLAAPDGTVLLATTSALAVNDAASRNKGFETGELRTVAIVASTPDVYAIHPGNAAKDFGDFIRRAKDDGINYGTAGYGTSPYIATEFFFREIAKVNATHIPFAGGAPAMTALMGGHIGMFAGAVPSAALQIQQKQVRGIGIAGPSRSPVLPEIPTLAEAGYPGFHSISWVGFFAPARTPDALVAKLNTEINGILSEPEVQQKLRTIGFEPRIQSAAEATVLFKDDVASWGKMSRAIGYSAQ